MMERTTERPLPLLTLVGTVHRDRHGEEKLFSLLERLAPTEITIEMSPTALDYRRQRGGAQLQRMEGILRRLARDLGRDPRELQTLPVIEDIRRLLELPFEYRSAAAYAESRRVPVHLIDVSEVSASKLRRVDRDLVTYRNLRILINHPTRTIGTAESCGEGYRSARAMVLENPRAETRRVFLERRRGREGVGLRDRQMAETIRMRLRHAGDGHLVHIGGWVHLVEDDRGETLYSRLRDFRPRRLLLEKSLCPVAAQGGIL